jgi:crotonobetainyl-CoA:carnitine CoA-transferase CaiB-like acyl-CoA transferase
MLARADVFVQNLSPGAVARAGFAPEELRHRFPRLVICSISGYGEKGPYRDMKAYDLLIQGETGLASITGAPEAPGRVGVSVSDIAAGLNAYAAILEALYARQRSGEGALLHIALFDATAEWMTVPLLHNDYAGAAPERVGIRHPSIAPYGAFTTGDGKAIIIGIQNEREWRRFCEAVLGDAALAADPRFASNVERVANRLALDDIIAARLATRTRDEVAGLLATADIAFGNLNTVADFSRHPQLRRMTVAAGAESIVLPASPGRDIADAVVPELGADSIAIRREFDS